MGGIIAISLPLLIGYAIAFAVYMGTSFAFAALFRSALASEGRPLPGFYAASAFAWFLATFCACYFVVTQAPYAWEIVLITLVILVVLFRSAYDFHPQQPKRLVILCAITIMISAVIVWKLVS
ncbi:MAG: hypothetical protein JSS87_05950 [Acidobacteria bacterium]|nr:hypothetical protein [Acidobacteriota bacterium]